MLVLSRKVGEGLKIGADIAVKIVDVRGDKVRLGITAPTHIVIDRDEIAERKKANIRRPSDDALRNPR